MSTPRILRDIKDLKQGAVEIQSQISNVALNNLVGKYYVPEVYKAEANKVVTANVLPTSWTGSGRYYYSGDYSVETTMNTSGTTNILSRAFDGNIDTAFLCIAVPGVSNEIIIKFPSPIKINSFNTYIQDVSTLDSIEIYGQKENSTNWVRLHYGGADGSSAELKSRELYSEVIDNYKYYKFVFIVETSNTSIPVRSIQVGSYTPLETYNEFTVEEVPTPLAINQRLMIKTPNEFELASIPVDKLNGIELDTLLLPNRYYEIVYDGTRYLAKEVV